MIAGIVYAFSEKIQLPAKEVFHMNEKQRANGAKKVPVKTVCTSAGMRKDRVRPLTHAPLPDEQSVREEMHWVMENQK